MSASVLPLICPRRADIVLVWLLLSLHLELGVDGERSSPHVSNPHQFLGRRCALERVLRLRGGGRDDAGRGCHRGSRGASPAVGSEVGEQRAPNSNSRAGKGKTALRPRAPRGSTTSMEFDPPPEKPPASSVESAPRTSPRTSSDTSERPAVDASERPAVMTMADRVRYGASPPPPEPRSPSPPLTLADIQKNYLEVPMRTKRESHRTVGGRHRGGKDQYTERRRRGSPGRVRWPRKPQSNVVHESKVASNYSEVGKDTFEVWKEWRKEIQEKVNDQGKFMLSGPRRSSVALTNDSWAELTAPYLLRVAVLGGRLPKWEQQQNSAFLRWAEPVVSHLQRKLRRAKVSTNASSVSNVAYEAYEQFPALGERPVLEGKHAFRPVREGQYAARRRERLRRSGKHNPDGESTSEPNSVGEWVRDPPLENVTVKKPWVDPQLQGGPTWRDIAYRGYYAALEREAKEQAEKEAKEQAEREAKAAEEERQERLRLKKREEKRKKKEKAMQKESKKGAGDKEVVVLLEHGTSRDPLLETSRNAREASRDSPASRDEKEERRAQEMQMQDEQQAREVKETPRGKPSSDLRAESYKVHEDASSPAPVEMDETKGSGVADSRTPSKRSSSPPPRMQEESPARPQRTGRKRVPGRSVLERMSPTPNMRTISCLLDEKGNQAEARESVSVPQGDVMKDDGVEGMGGVEMMSSMSVLEEKEEGSEGGGGEAPVKRVVTKRVRPKWLSFGHAWLMILRREILKTESLFQPPVRSPVVISLPDCPLLPPAHHSCSGMRTLVIDLDETLIHTALDDGQNCWVTHKRPGAAQFLTSLAEHYEIVIFTAGMETYAGPIIDELDPRNVIAHRLFRGSCAILAGYGTEQRPIHVKDLVLLGRDLARTMIIDNSPESYFLQPENAVPIKPFFGDKDDRELEALEAFLLHIIRADVGDVRKMLQQCHERGRFRVRRDDVAEGLRSSSSNLRSRSVSSVSTCRRVVPEHVLAEVADYHEERQKAAGEMMMMMSKLEPQRTTSNKDTSTKKDRKPTPQKAPQHQAGKSFPGGVRDAKESASKGGTSAPTKDKQPVSLPSSQADFSDDPRPVGKPSRALTHWGDFEEGLDGGLPGTARGEVDTKISFVQWLLTQKKDDTPIGHIVRNTYDDIRGLGAKLGDGVSGDSAKIHRKTYRALRKRMEALGSPDHALSVCDEAYETYLRDVADVHEKF